MPYKPKIVAGKVTGTGYPIDGHVLYFSLWDYDPDNWHLYGWDDADDEAVMLTMFQAERDAGTGTCLSLKTFRKKWQAKEWEPEGPFSLVLDAVEVVEVKQEEEKSDARERLLANGIDLSPRKETDRGGILCLPMEKNLNGDVKAKHPNWELIKCPTCGRGCWKPPEIDELIEKQGVQILCTECALEAGLVSPYPRTPAPAKPSANREQRRRASREHKKG